MAQSTPEYSFKKIKIITLIIAVIIAVGLGTLFAVDYLSPSNVTSVQEGEGWIIAHFSVIGVLSADAPERMFSMLREDEGMYIHITEDTQIFMVAGTLSEGQTLEEVLDGRRLKVVYVMRRLSVPLHTIAISITVLDS